MTELSTPNCRGTLLFNYEVRHQYIDGGQLEDALTKRIFQIKPWIKLWEMVK